MLEDKFMWGRFLLIILGDCVFCINNKILFILEISIQVWSLKQDWGLIVTLAAGSLFYMKEKLPDVEYSTTL